MSEYMHLVAREGEGFAMFLEEGNFTRNDNFRGDNGITRGGSYAAQVNNGDLVQIYTGADRTVEKSSTGITIGYVDGEPIYENPAASATSGNYTRARGNIVLMGGNVHKVKLDAANQAITPGTYLAIDTTNKNGFDKEEDAASQPTNVIALESADASSGVSILAFVVGIPVVENDAGA